jgi:hypothetical protein
MQPAIARLLPLLLAVILIGACGSRQANEGRFAEGAPLQVRNQSWSDIRIFVITTGGQRTRLGTVHASSTATLQIPARLVGGGQEVRFEALPIGSRAAATSFSHFVRPGETVTLTVPPGVR